MFIVEIEYKSNTREFIGPFDTDEQCHGWAERNVPSTAKFTVHSLHQDHEGKNVA